MTPGTAVHQAMANLVKLREIPDAIIEAWAEPWATVNFRWNNWRPRRIARNGSRAIMNRDEPGVSISPRRIRSNLLLQRFLNARVQGIRGFRDVRELGAYGPTEAPDSPTQQQEYPPGW